MENLDFLYEIDGETWFIENDRNNLKISYKVKEVLSSVKSVYQQINIIDIYDFGRCLILDGVIQTTELDGYIYNEMLSHVPVITHPHPQDVLIIGGGDCGVANELSKYNFLKKIDMVEIDELVVRECIKYMPSVTGMASYDERINFIFNDGIEYIKDKNAMYDIIIIDSSDPVGPAEDLFKESFYLNAKKCLKPDGILTCQSQSPLFNKDIMARTYKILSKYFAIVKIYVASVPSYPGGFWSFTIASDYFDPDKADISKLADNTRYINREVFHSSFKLPNFIKEIINHV
ncbi:MAG TPA: polyamine aminopropyltransferase [Clostridiaceae bacterium]|nr:polyamine aminopropyltransferase [Clostridiaceae bacterium]